MEIKEISKSDALELIANSEEAEQFEPLGLFWYRDQSCGHFVAIDNSTGNAYIEEFDTVAGCLKYLRREACTAVSGFTYW